MKKIVDYIFPKICIGCGTTGDELCADCKKTLESHAEICPVSHRHSADFAVHIDHRKETAYDGIVIGFSYQDILKKLILQLKYYHRYAVADFLVDRLFLVLSTNQTLQRLIKNKKLVVTSIPSHRYRRYFVKGYNQSELLARGLAKKLGAEYSPFLTKTKHTRIQAFLSREKRMSNLE